MLQILQNLKDGKTELVEVPSPGGRPGHLLIASSYTLISAGTERMLVEFSQGNLIEKARSQPERVRQVMDKVQTDGLATTVESVMRKLDQPLPLGYCNSGVVLEVGEGVSGFAVGDRVVSNGLHSQIVCIPQNLCAQIPDEVDSADASFTVLGAVALQGIRLVNPTLGERVVVVGLGLVGLMAIQMLIANGCQVLGIDFNPHRLELARQYGAQTVDLSKGMDPVAAAMSFSNGHGVDAVLITASTKSDEPVHQAAQMSRQRGRIVLVGVTGLQLNRADFYEKELTFQVSCSYGPGRYDPAYENQGQDYPFGFVRWTEQRNFEAVLQLMATKRLDINSLITDRVKFESATTAYKALTNGSGASSLGIILDYQNNAEVDRRERVKVSATVETASTENKNIDKAVVGVIGAGNFAMGVLLPALKKTPAVLEVVASSTGTSAAIAAKKFGFHEATSSVSSVLDDPNVNTVLITTRHNTHAQFVVRALDAGKHVFVEKPLALNREELADVKLAVNRNPGQKLCVGFNRRFSPLAQQMKKLTESRVEPMSLIYTVNAGYIPDDHWTHDPQIGGGRIIGEACHFIDLLHYLVDSDIVSVQPHMMGASNSVANQGDTMSISLGFADGSLGVVHYFSNGHRSFTKERLDVFTDGRMLALDNFRALNGYGWSGFKKTKSYRQNKGHNEELAQFISSVTSGGDWPISWESLEQTTLSTFEAVEQS